MHFLHVRFSLVSVWETELWLTCLVRFGQNSKTLLRLATNRNIFIYSLVQCAVSHHHGARRSSNRNSFTFFRLHCLYVLTRWRAGLCMGSILAEFLAGHIHNWLKSMALKTPSTKRYIGEIKSINVWSYPQTYSVDHQWHLWQLIHTLFCFGSIHTLFTA